MEDNGPKGPLILHTFPGFSDLGRKASQGASEEEPASHQLVGGVMAYQGEDA